MLSPEIFRQAERALVSAAGYCCGCDKRLTDDETYYCSICEKEIAAFHDPNGVMKEDEYE